MNCIRNKTWVKMTLTTLSVNLANLSRHLRPQVPENIVKRQCEGI